VMIRTSLNSLGVGSCAGEGGGALVYKVCSEFT
jgi:hypothetical protein